jgi:hypothetical protein
VIARGRRVVRRLLAVLAHDLPGGSSIREAERRREPSSGAAFAEHHWQLRGSIETALLVAARIRTSFTSGAFRVSSQPNLCP